MKKSSILVTLFLVVALVFAVSCPSGPQVSVITTNSNKAIQAAIDEVLDDFTFDIEVANGAFASDALNQELTIKGLSAFNSTEAEATAKATITELEAADAFTNKVTRATVTVSGFIPKSVSQYIRDLVFEIPTIKTDEKKILEDVTTAVTIGGAISINVLYTDVKVTVEPAELSFTLGIPISDNNTVIFTLDGANWKQDSLPSLNPGIWGYALTCNFSIDDSDARKIKLTVTGTPNATTTHYPDGEEFFFYIYDNIEEMPGYEIHAGYSIKTSFRIKITPATEKAPTTASMSGNSAVEFTAGEEDSIVNL